MSQEQNKSGNNGNTLETKNSDVVKKSTKKYPAPICGLNGNALNRLYELLYSDKASHTH